MSSIVKIFNEQYKEFLDEVIILFPNNTDLKTGKTFCLSAMKANPLFIIKLWQSTVLPYYDKINNFDFDFFENKDYSNDVKNLKKQAEKGLRIISHIKQEIKNTSKENKTKCMKWIQNLCKLNLIYMNDK